MDLFNLFGRSTQSSIGKRVPLRAERNLGHMLCLTGSSEPVVLVLIIYLTTSYIRWRISWFGNGFVRYVDSTETADLSKAAGAESRRTKTNQSFDQNGTGCDHGPYFPPFTYYEKQIIRRKRLTSR